VTDAATPGAHDPQISVVLCTYNRAHLLEGALDALTRQTGAPPFEVIVVDNNSGDRTRAIVERFTAGGIVRYAYEPRQGLSFARNLGVSLARADRIAFTDDDVRASAAWVRSIAEAFDANPDVGIVGGRVEPVWEAAPPGWLHNAGNAPLALLDFGDRPFRIAADRPVCLIGANLALRRAVLERVGGFSPALQRVGDGVGSTEDYDLQRRALDAGEIALYDPRIVVHAPVPRERLMKRYHRAWHTGHGRFYALMRDPAFEASRAGRFLGVPAHVYRRAVVETAGWGASLLALRGEAAFAHELRLRFLAGYAVQRIFHDDRSA
jgi:glycosyltransferase involved in cell wall biosynthesis